MPLLECADLRFHKLQIIGPFDNDSSEHKNWIIRVNPVKRVIARLIQKKSFTASSFFCAQGAVLLVDRARAELILRMS